MWLSGSSIWASKLTRRPDPATHSPHVDDAATTSIHEIKQLLIIFHSIVATINGPENGVYKNLFEQCQVLPCISDLNI
jgi:hypothetical protein